MAAAHEEAPSTDPAAPPPPRFHLHQRISHRHSRGTIRFIGELSSLKGQWLGIEWDDRKRGRHWGEYQGYTYFTCRYHRRPPPLQGGEEGDVRERKTERGPASFLRPTAPGLKTGTSILHALKHKYGAAPPSITGNHNNDENEKHKAQERYSRKNLAEIEIEIPDLDKVRRKVANLARLRVAGLQGKVLPLAVTEDSRREDGTKVEAEVEDEEEESMLVSSVLSMERGERPGDLIMLFPNISVLDLSNNLLASWHTLKTLASELPNLTSLNISGNRLAPLQADDLVVDVKSATSTASFMNLEELLLDRTFISWKEMLEIISEKGLFPRLQTLSCAGNDLQRLLPAADEPISKRQDDEKHHLPSLKQLNLANNSLGDWHDFLRALAHPIFKNLERVNLSSNSFRSIPALARPEEKLSCSHINISFNHHLKSWSDIENLHASTLHGIQSLVLDLPSPPPPPSPPPSTKTSHEQQNGDTTLTTRDNLITAANWRDLHPSDARLVLIARLGDLKSLNSTPVSVEERREAEIYFLSKFVDSLPAHSASSSSTASTQAQPFARFAGLARKYTAHVPAAAVYLGLADEQTQRAYTADAKARAKREQPVTLKSKMLDLQVRLTRSCPEDEEEGEEEERIGNVKLLPSTPLRMVRTKVLKLVQSTKGEKMEQDQVKLWAVLNADAEPEDGNDDDADLPEKSGEEERKRLLVPMDDDSKPLEHFGIGPRDCIIIQLVS